MRGAGTKRGKKIKKKGVECEELAAPGHRL